FTLFLRNCCAAIHRLRHLENLRHLDLSDGCTVGCITGLLHFSRNASIQIRRRLSSSSPRERQRPCKSCTAAKGRFPRCISDWTMAYSIPSIARSCVTLPDRNFTSPQSISRSCSSATVGKTKD